MPRQRRHAHPLRRFGTLPREVTVRNRPGRQLNRTVTFSVRVYAQAAEANVYHLRLHRGSREVDLIVERGDGKVVAIEVKLSRTVDDVDVKHLHWLRDELGDGLLDAVVVNTGPNAYRRPDGIAVVPAVLLGE
jgi:uncharacterized protein